MAVDKSKLEKIAGKKNVLDDESTLMQFSQDQSFVPARRPDAVVYVEKLEQVQEIVKLANETRTPIVPFSSGLTLRGAAIPDQGGIILNMSRMNKIIEIDEENLFAMVEPGVTYKQLQDTLTPKGFKIMAPFGIPADRSVMTSYLERDPVMAAPCFEDGNSLIMDTEIVLPNGDIFHTGNWASGGRPGAPSGPIRTNILRMFTGAQGTLGIMTKMVVQISYIPAARKIFFIPFKNLADAVEPMKRIQRREIGTESCLISNFNLAALLTESWKVPATFPVKPVDAKEFGEIRKVLPAWTLVIVINGPKRRTDEKIAYEATALKELCDSLNVQLLESLPNVTGAENIIEAEILRPWGVLRKFNYKGSVHDLTFKAPITKIAELEKLMTELAHQAGYPAADIGMYLMPLERGRAIHCEFDLHCPAADGAERESVKKLWQKASAELINNGAYFDRPYGIWAPLMYSRAAGYSQMLKKLKAETDPNNILNPGKLCFA
jgi:FAD/FMN-containing dehydrogenase